MYTDHLKNFENAGNLSGKAWQHAMNFDGILMPTISMFYGIIIRMYFAPDEHNPPHFHAYYNEFKATIQLDTLEIMEGTLPRKQLRLVQAWAELHHDELKANWRMAMNGEHPYKIEPLR
jgi:Domain of unknown function (DUF4160)